MSQLVKKFNQEETYVFNLSNNVLTSLNLMYFDSSTIEEVSPQTLHTNSDLDRVQEIDEKSQVVKSKEYYKSDFYRLNLKRELRGLPKLTEEEFDSLEGELNESISGSEESEDDSETETQEVIRKNKRKYSFDTIYEKSIEKLEKLKVEQDDEGVVSHLATKSPFILFKSDLLDEERCFGIYKSLFTLEEIVNPVETLKIWNSSNQKSKKSALFMIGGGHFAGAIINHKPKSTKGNSVKAGDSIFEQAVDVVAHKSFHRYTTRRKQGGSQSASDNARGKANSAGSSLRRHNEAALQSEVRELIRSWKEHLDECDSIFIRANGPATKNILVGYEGAILKNDDPRIKGFPFTTKRATTTELKRAWVQLTYMTITNKPKIDDKKLKQKLVQQQIQQSIVKKSKELKPVSDSEKHTVELVGFLKRSRGPVLVSYVKKHKISPEFKLEPISDYHNTPTLLHYASANGIKNLIPVLVKTLKSDIKSQNSNGKTPYDIAANKQVRQTFQILRSELGEDFADWEEAHVGKPISKEEVEKDDQQEKNKIEDEKKELIKKELEKKNDLPVSKTTRLVGISLSNANLSSLSEDQQKRLMREQRARAAEARFKALQAQNSQK